MLCVSDGSDAVPYGDEWKVVEPQPELPGSADNYVAHGLALKLAKCWTGIVALLSAKPFVMGGPGATLLTLTKRNDVTVQAPPMSGGNLEENSCPGCKAKTSRFEFRGLKEEKYFYLI